MIDTMSALEHLQGGNRHFVHGLRSVETFKAT